MHINRWLFAALVYLTFMGLGILTGGYISGYAHNHINRTPIPTIHELATKVTQTQKSYPVPTLPQIYPTERNETSLQPIQQTNYLLLFVDDLSAKKPKLTGVYVWIAQNETERWIFLPIYDPNLVPPLTDSFAKELKKDFAISADRQINPKFLDQLNSHSILWHHYILIDNLFLEKLAVLVDIQNPTPLNLMQQFCQIIPQTSVDLNTLKDISSLHFYSDNSISSFTQPGSMTLNRFPLKCDFPTLTK